MGAGPVPPGAVTVTPLGSPDVRTTLGLLQPMLALAGGRPELLPTLVGSHIFDEKLDGIRALAAFDHEGLVLRNRNGRDITANYPDLEQSAIGLLQGPLILDGEIVASHGKFQDIARRDKQKQPAAILRAMLDIPATFMAFDVLHHPYRGDVRHLNYTERRDLLADLLGNGSTHWAMTTASGDPAFFDKIRLMGGEGVIAKRRTARYTAGRNEAWLKFKTVQSITCLAVGYEPGNGRRADMGAILLGLIKDNSIVLVGKAGSGFSQATATDMKNALDAVAASGDYSALPLVEIECLGRSRDNKLRQPAFKGVRSDLMLHDARYEQIENLPQT